MPQPPFNGLRDSGAAAALLVIAITLVGLLLRLPSLGNSLFGDELSTYFIVSHHSLGQILTILHGHSVDLTPPLYFALAWLAERAGSSPELLRLVSLLAGTATIVLTYLVGSRIVGRAAAGVGAALMALSPFMIFYSTEARAYALVTALALVSTLALRNATENGSRRWWIAYAAFSCAAVYAQYTAVFVLVAQFVWALAYHRASARALIAANLAAAIGFLPWLPALIDNTRSAGTQAFALLEPFNLTDVSRDLAHWGIGHPYIQLGAVPGGLAIVLVLLGVLNAGALAAVGKLAVGAPGAPGAPGRPSRPSSGIVLAVALAIAAPLGLVLYSLLRESIWDPRNLCISSPGLALVLGALLTSSRAPLVRLVSVGAVVVGFAIGATKLLEARYERPDYAGAAALVLRTGGARDPVAVVPVPTPGPLSAMDAAFAYAGDRGRELQRIGTAPLAAVLRAAPYALLAATPPGVLAAQSARRPGDRLFVVAPGTASLANLLRSGRVNTRAVLGPVFGTGRNGLLLGTVYAPLSAYLKAVARRFRPLGTRTFPGFLRLSVYVFARR